MAETGSAVAGKVVDSLFVVAKKQISYMWNYTQNVDTLKRALQDLKGMRERVQVQIDIAIRNGDNLLEGAKKWVKGADEEISKAEEFVEEETNAKKTCFKLAMCGNWHTLHHYGRKAIKMAPLILQQQVSGTPYERCVSIETPAPGPLDVYQNKDLDDLHTHNSALGYIIKSLEDESTQITGIYGLGGVGKTTLAMEVAARVKNNLFADVAFTTVSLTINAEKIQKDLENATKRIMKGDKILIILDDVWEKLNLEKLCIPCGNNFMTCKILLTSRSEKVCRKMNAQRIIWVNSLPIEEAWILFKRVVGKRLETDFNLKPVALKVVEECGGLPLLIQAVGNALKDESTKSWESALTQLQKHAPLDIDEEIRKSFTHLKLSYEYLKSEEAKSCFLLCSMFPEDYIIPLEDLVFFGVALEKFDDLDSIEDARSRVQNAVNILTSSGLLLNVGNEEVTKMHDVVRDVALLIASEGNNKFLVKAWQGLTEWLPRDTSLESYKGIALISNNIIKLPSYKVNVPNLEIFFVCGNRDLSMISDEFIGCMKKLKLLDISWNNISSLPQSFQLLTKLRTLDLRGNKSLYEISILGELKALEILILNGTGIIEIPKEICQLVNLRVLEIKDCVDLSRITQGVISALWRLEELCIEFMLKFKGASDCIVEVISLSKLAYLDLTVPSIDQIPTDGQGFNSETLKGFVIEIGEYRRDVGVKVVFLSRSGRYLVLSAVHLRIPLAKWLKNLIEGSLPNIILYGIENLNNVMPTLYHQGFTKLQNIHLNDCPNVSCLVDNDTRCNRDEGKTKEKFFKELKHIELWYLENLEVLWKCPDECISLTNLVTLYIEGSDKLGSVFTVRVAQGLVNLNFLFIRNCDGLEDVIWGGDGGDDESGCIIVFPSLAQIFLLKLRRLKSFYLGSENCSFEYPSLVEVKIGGCGSMQIWGHGIHETPNLKTLVVNPYDDVRRLQLDGPNAINDVVAKARDLDKRKQQANLYKPNAK
uniref:probable disease resistance protein At4g27220 n=1 Tax=Erigeron canadensis TaxID=72917 RepID=UPI001CB8DE5F|nr:probable disease resistance protein At4g27220 [Erigeron canadensis]